MGGLGLGHITWLSSPERCGWQLRSEGAPWVAQRVCEMPTCLDTCSSNLTAAPSPRIFSSSSATLPVLLIRTVPWRSYFYLVLLCVLP